MLRDCERISIPDAELSYLPFLPLDRPADEVMQHLIAEVPWRAEEVVVFGRKVMQPRLTAWYG
ncbi:MAG: hypothetical protein ACREFA_05560, partial [Stellaceae bacterium]